MAGWLTNGLPTIGAITVNGTLQTPPLGTYTQLTSGSLIPVDTKSANGQSPQSVAATAFQVAAVAAGLITNTGSSTAGAATLNTTSGLVTTEALTTAAGATYTFTLTNSLIAASSAAPQVELRDGTNTAGGAQINSITNGSGSVVAVFQNTGTAAWNGKKLFLFHV